MKMHLLLLGKPFRPLIFANGWRRISALFFFYISLSAVTFAQSKIWDKTIGGSGNDRFRALIRTQDSGYLLSGYSASGINGDKTQAGTGTWLVKLKADGTKVWDKVISEEALTVQQQTQDGGYLLGGGTPDYQLVKLYGNGKIAWHKTFGGSKIDVFAEAHQTNDGGYIVGGYSESGISGDKTEVSRGDRDYWIIKLKADGTKEWDKTLGGDDIDLLTSVRQTLDGGYILGGSSVSFKSGDKSEDLIGYAEQDPSDYWVVKVDSKGNKVWDNTIGGKGGDQLEEVRQTLDGGYILGGTSNSYISSDKTEASKGWEDYWIVKLNPDGTKAWDKTIGGKDPDGLVAVEQTSDGGYILGGGSSSGIGGDKTEPNKGKPNAYGELTSDYWVVKIDANGNKLWDKTLGGEENDALNSVEQTRDGDYILGGSSRSNKSGDKSEDNKGVVEEIGSWDYWVIKIKEKTAPETTVWNMRYGGAGTDNFTSVIKTIDGGYLSGGYTASGKSGDKTQTSQGKNDYWIVKSDKNGKKLWDKRYGGSEEDYLNSVIQTSDGGYLLAGSSLSGKSGDKSQDSQGERDYWVVKVDAQGNKQWDKRFGGSGYDELKHVYQLASGRYLLAGTSSSPASGDKRLNSQGGQDYWVLKITATGERIWDKRYGGSGNDVLEGLAPTREDGFLLGGTSDSRVSGDKTQASRGGTDYWLVRIDGDGNQMWDKRFGGNGEDRLMALGSTGTTSGNFFVAGTSSSGKGGDKSQDSQGGKDYWLLKINGKGGKLWDKRFGGSQDEELRSIILTQDGGYLLGGSSTSSKSGDKSQTSQGQKDYWLVKTDDKGNAQWDKQLGGNQEEELRTILELPEGAYVAGGRSDSGVSGDRTQPSQGGTDYWLVKFTPETSSIVAARQATLVEETATLAHSLTAYPNPFQSRVMVSFTLPQNQMATVKVYDSQGNEVSTLFQGEAKAKQTYQVQWQASGKEAGLYFLQLQTSTLRHQQKLLLTK